MQNYWVISKPTREVSSNCYDKEPVSKYNRKLLISQFEKLYNFIAEEYNMPPMVLKPYRYLVYTDV